MKRIKLYSFDIFDTCLIRACGRPEFVFDILAKRVLGKNADMTQCMDFAYIRRGAESLAIKQNVTKDVEEITLDEIYDKCNFSSLTNLSKDKIKGIELELERELLYPVLEIKEIINSIRAKKNKIIFISDMYLPSLFIKSILIDRGIMLERDKLYVSSEFKKKKSTGSLYEYIREAEGVSYKEWKHFGDNIISDVKVPRKLGIKVQRTFHPWSYYERMLALQEMTSNQYNLKMMASISKTVRLQSPQSPELFFAADLIAPIYVPFVYNIMSEAEKRGITSIFFLARDGYIFYKIALRLKKRFPYLNLHYLYVSRKSLYLPGLKDLSYNSLKSSFFSWDRYTLSDVLDKFQLDDDEVYSNYRSLSGEELLLALLKDPLFVNNLRNKRNEQRNLCLEYFISEGLSKDNIAIVDLSGSRKCHISINAILESQGYPPTFGFYFDVLNNHIVDDNYYSTFFSGRYGFNYMNIRKEPQVVFEQYFSLSPHDRTISYCKKQGQVVPLFEKDVTDIPQKSEKFEINCKICELFADLFLNIYDKSCSRELIGPALHIYTLFYYAPNPYYLKAIINVCESNSINQIIPLVKKQSMLIYILKKKKGWFYGNLIYNISFKRIGFKLLVILYLFKKWKKSNELL